MRYAHVRETITTPEEGVFEVWSRSHMPYVPSIVLEGGIYLYKTKDAALAGEQSGGSGFFVAVPSKVFKDRAHVYAVSCAHVIFTHPVIRYNMPRGRIGVLELSVDEWVPHPDGDDIAIHDVVDDLGLQVMACSRDQFLDNDEIEYWGVGPGDNCMMVGRFIDHDGVQRNRPFIRFGNLAMMEEMVYQGRKRARDQLSYLVEMRSLSGFSGSAVFVYLEGIGHRALPDGRILKTYTTVPRKVWLLGVNWGHIPATDLDPTSNERVDDKAAAALSSAVAAVVPAWKVAEMLDDPVLEQRRHDLDERDRQERPDKFGGGVLNVAETGDVFTQDDFDKALHRATRILPPSEPAPEG
jgi:hypothetical protein